MDRLNTDVGAEAPRDRSHNVLLPLFRNGQM